MTVDSSWDLPLELEIAPAPVPKTGGATGGRGRPRGVIRRDFETIDGVDFYVEEIAPESFPPARRGKGKVGKYAAPKPRTVEAAGSGSGLWTGSQGDQTLLNTCLPHTKAAMKFAAEHGSLVDAPWQVIGITALKRAVRAARVFEEENCPPWEVQHVIDDWDEDLKAIMEEVNREHE